MNLKMADTLATKPSNRPLPETPVLRVRPLTNGYAYQINRQKVTSWKPLLTRKLNS